MPKLINTPKPPYYAVIFTSTRTDGEKEYTQRANEMVELASKQLGFLGVESVRDSIGITVSYWKDLDSIKNWKLNTEHIKIQKLGRDKWYSEFQVRICKVEREYGFIK